jgi:hypothetical protein
MRVVTPAAQHGALRAGSSEASSVRFNIWGIVVLLDRTEPLALQNYKFIDVGDPEEEVHDSRREVTSEIQKVFGAF